MCQGVGIPGIPHVGHSLCPSSTALPSCRSLQSGANAPSRRWPLPIEGGGWHLGFGISAKLSLPVPTTRISNLQNLPHPHFLQTMSEQPGLKPSLEIQIRTGLTALESKNEVRVETIYRRTAQERESKQRRQFLVRVIKLLLPLQTNNKQSQSPISKHSSPHEGRFVFKDSRLDGDFPTLPFPSPN